MSNKDDIKKDGFLKDDNLDIEDLKKVSGGLVNVIEGPYKSDDDTPMLDATGYDMRKGTENDRWEEGSGVNKGKWFYNDGRIVED